MKTAEELQKELDDSKAKADENIKALQQKLTEKDKTVKEIEAQITELRKKKPEDDEATKKIDELTKTVGELTTKIGTINTDNEKQKLAEKYPDILPEMLIGKTDEEKERIVERQREIIKKNYDINPSDHAPIYKDKTEVATAIEEIKKDQSLSTEEKLVKLGEVKSRIKDD